MMQFLVSCRSGHLRTLTRCGSHLNSHLCKHFIPAINNQKIRLFCSTNNPDNQNNADIESQSSSQTKIHSESRKNKSRFESQRHQSNPTDRNEQLIHEMMKEDILCDNEIRDPSEYTREEQNVFRIVKQLIEKDFIDLPELYEIVKFYI